LFNEIHIDKFQNAFNSQCNDCLVRSIPLGFILDKQKRETAVLLNTMITNPNWNSYHCVNIYTTAISIILISEKTIETLINVYNYFQEYCKQWNIDIVIDIEKIANNNFIDNKIFKELKWKLSKNKITTSLFITFLALKYAIINPCYSTVIEYVINLGGDTIINASLIGGLLGTFFGYEYMKNNDEITSQNIATLMNYLNGNNMDDTEVPRPDNYILKDLDILIKNFPFFSSEKFNFVTPFPLFYDNSEIYQNNIFQQYQLTQIYKTNWDLHQEIYSNIQYINDYLDNFSKLINNFNNVFVNDL